MAPEKYVRIVDELRRNIFAGLYGPQGGLPTAQAIATNYNVTVNTAGKALSYLEGEKLVVKHGSNFYVNALNVRMTEHVPASHIRLTHGYTRNISSVDMVDLPIHIMEKLAIPTTKAIYRAQISGEQDGNEFIPVQIARRYYFLELTNEEVTNMVNDATYDPMWTKVPVQLLSHDDIAARNATGEETQLLNLSHTSSVLDVWEVIYNMSGNVLMAQEITLSPRMKHSFRYPFDNKPKA